MSPHPTPGRAGYWRAIVTRGGLAALTAAALVHAFTPAAGAQGLEPERLGYCLPTNPAADPVDVQEGGSRHGPLPPGFSEREVVIDGTRTVVVDGGPRRARTAVVLVHGNPGAGHHWVPVLRRVARRHRVVAYDVPGWGHADDGRSFPYTLDGQTDFLEALLRKLRVRRALIGGHDVGASFALEWAVRNPRRTAGVVIMNGGIVPGYQWHFLARVWRTPTLGEGFWAAMNRQLWRSGLRQRPKPLPQEFVDSMYDDLDRLTRCAILDTYRAAPAHPGTIGVRQARALRPYDLPALVIWGRHDQFIGPAYARKQRLAFPRARIRVFDRAGHWPFVDARARTSALLTRFAASAVSSRKPR